MSIRTEVEKIIPILAKWWVRDTTFSVLVAFSSMLMAKSAIEYGYDFAMRRYKYLPLEAPPVGSDFGPTEYLAVLVLIVAIGYRLWVVRGTAAETADHATREALNSSSTGSLLQLEHRKAFGILATVPEIEALRAHPTNALGMTLAHASGARHVAWDGIWFTLASRHHGVKRGLVLIAFTISAVAALVILVVAAGTYAKAGVVSIMASALAAEGVLLVFASASYLKDLERLNSACALLKERPPLTVSTTP
ncbi:hypothetical protein DSM25558_4499 [Agrobacterium sp. DSM 25558]|uniref:hypothetical protein n=1 Tax=Agrobacterium sp. DSM 25558 TaxID=1907665 RepID=UPI00097248CD|nr:hypothetical protein [Agrobacterium sp. DSM 25558]SCX28536.1 hypothetical protein DSM25558_4499 [Agrobacterium sp. DSM 25558]